MKWWTTDDEFHDQNADTDLVAHGYWSLCLNDDQSAWRLTLLEQSEDLSDIVAEHYTGEFPTEERAKGFAATQEALPDIFWTDYAFKEAQT